MHDLRETAEEDHLDVLVCHELDVEREREIVKRVDAKMTEDGYTVPDEN